VISAPGQKVLVCALDWGLGHATRTSQLIRSWLSSGTEITLAGNGRSLAFWQVEFPDLPIRELPDYAVTYAPGPFLIPQLASSIPRLLRIRNAEAAKVRSWRGEFDAVVSDNRFGCFLPGKTSWFITHQLHLAAPSGFGWSEPLLERVMARALRAFDRILIPDSEVGGLSGKLGHPAHPERFPPMDWIGPLSRFSNLPPHPSPWSGPWNTLALISGPEPARTSFEHDVRTLLASRPGRHLVVRGLPHLPSDTAPAADAPIQEAPHLATNDLAAALRGAREIITRGGYSTLMDLDALGRLDPSCLLVPTPGQTEQEYLARHLAGSRGVRWTPAGRFLTDSIRFKSSTEYSV